MQTLVLLIDFKADGERLWPYLVEQLEPLRRAVYLTISMAPRSFNVPSPSSSRAMRLQSRSRAENQTRCILRFPLEELTLEEESPYNPHNGYYASTDFRRAIGAIVKSRFSQDQLAEIRRQVKRAHQQGLKVRYWGTPTWPRRLWNHVWHVLVREGWT